MKLILIILFPLFLNAEVLFQKKEIKVGGHKVAADIADTPEKSRHGMMFRKKIGPNEGMLFVFEDEAPRSFWMKNTFIDLDIGFFNSKKKLIDVQTMKSVKSEMELEPPVYESKYPAQYALEMPAGWFSKNKIKQGASLEIPK